MDAARGAAQLTLDLLGDFAAGSSPAPGTKHRNELRERPGLGRAKFCLGGDFGTYDVPHYNRSGLVLCRTVTSCGKLLCLTAIMPAKRIPYPLVVHRALRLHERCRLRPLILALLGCHTLFS